MAPLSVSMTPCRPPELFAPTGTLGLRGPDAPHAASKQRARPAATTRARAWPMCRLEPEANAGREHVGRRVPGMFHLAPRIRWNRIGGHRRLATIQVQILRAPRNQSREPAFHAAANRDAVEIVLLVDGVLHVRHRRLTR